MLFTLKDITENIITKLDIKDIKNFMVLSKETRIFFWNTVNFYMNIKSLKYINELPRNLYSLNLNDTKVCWNQRSQPGGESSAFPQIIPDTLPKNLKILYLGNTRVSIIPNTLPQNLRILDLSGTKVSRIPENFPQNLRELYLSRTEVSIIPDHLPKNLHELYLSYTMVLIIPEDLPKNLREFNLQDTKISKILKNLPKNWKKFYLKSIIKINNLKNSLMI